MSGLQGLQTTDWERRGLAETADATAHIYPDRTRVIRELLSDYDVLRAETATLTAEVEALRAQVAQSRGLLQAFVHASYSIEFRREQDADEVDDLATKAAQFLASTAPFGEEPTR